jgi:hypothetical protein
MRVTIEKDLNEVDALRVLTECLGMTKVCRNSENMVLKYDEDLEHKVVVNTLTGNVYDDNGDAYEALMCLANSIVPNMDDRKRWHINYWKPLSVYGNPRIPTGQQEYFMCTVSLDGHTSIKPCWFGDGHWWYGLTEIDDYVIAYLPNIEPYDSVKHNGKD